MRKKGENSVKFAGKKLRFRLTKLMISRFGVASQTVRGTSRCGRNRG
jgi:hypothetical protein